jgi:hypothetical protein
VKCVYIFTLTVVIIVVITAVAAHLQLGLEVGDGESVGGRRLFLKRLCFLPGVGVSGLGLRA